MNVYEKLQKARVLLQNTNIKKSGQNPFAKYEYFELADFLPAVNEIMDSLKLSSVLKVVNSEARLIIFNSEMPNEKIVFSMPFVVPELKGTNSIQNIGAGITYIRRYLLTIAFEIVEHDVIDNQPLEDKKENKKEEKENIDDLYRLFLSLEKSKNIPVEKVGNIEKVKKYFDEKKLKIQTLKNAIEYLGSLEPKKAMVFEKLSDSDLELAFEKGE